MFSALLFLPYLQLAHLLNSGAFLSRWSWKEDPASSRFFAQAWTSGLRLHPQPFKGYPALTTLSTSAVSSKIEGVMVAESEIPRM